MKPQTTRFTANYAVHRRPEPLPPSVDRYDRARRLFTLLQDRMVSRSVTVQKRYAAPEAPRVRANFPPGYSSILDPRKRHLARFAASSLLQDHESNGETSS